MGCEYALVHLKYTIPPALLLFALYRPLCTKLDVYKVGFLITIAVVSTIPWDSYLIRHRVWTYPPDVIVGPTLFDIPLEEVFFFVIQTFNTSLLYLLLNKPTLHAAYLQPKAKWRGWHWLGLAVLGLAVGWAFSAVRQGGEAMYLGLIVIWSGPFLFLLWGLAYQLLIGLPARNTVLPIALPTLYLWVVDTIALRRGTWVIESDTKLGWQLWRGLEVEEAFFFLATNMLIVFGLAAFDNALAVLHSFPALFPEVPYWPSPVLLIHALLTPASAYDMARIEGLRNAATRLARKSRSFFLASGTFEGRTRLDLILLYSFCRVADDLVDEAESKEAATAWVTKLRRYLNMRYANPEDESKVSAFVTAEFPESAWSSLNLLPTSYLTKRPLDELLNGFEMDLAFSQAPGTTDEPTWPIRDDKDLATYGMRVAGTVAELCLDIIFHHHPSSASTFSGDTNRTEITQSGVQMGIALQFVNIARDIAVDARNGRVYLPLTWLDAEDLSPRAVLKNPRGTRINSMRAKLLDEAFKLYSDARAAIEELPPEVRAPMRVAVESYMEIGRVLRRGEYEVKAGKATVPRGRRVWVAWNALRG